MFSVLIAVHTIQKSKKKTNNNTKMCNSYHSHTNNTMHISSYVFKQSDCIDWIRACYIQSLTEI